MLGGKGLAVVMLPETDMPVEYPVPPTEAYLVDANKIVFAHDAREADYADGVAGDGINHSCRPVLIDF